MAAAEHPYSGCQKNVPLFEGFFLQPLIPSLYISELIFEKRYKINTGKHRCPRMGIPEDQLDKNIKPGNSTPGKLFKYKSIQKNMLQIAIFDSLIKHGISRKDAKTIVRNKIPEYLDPNKPFMCIKTDGGMNIKWASSPAEINEAFDSLVVLNVAKMMAGIRQMLSKW